MSNELKAFIYKDFKEKEKNYPKGSDSSRLVRTTGLAPLAARPDKRLSIVWFAFIPFCLLTITGKQIAPAIFSTLKPCR